ncbi:MAG: hypothetical protein P8Y23_10125 [Candidatus Lokiarchaeota archaeon]
MRCLNGLGFDSPRLQLYGNDVWWDTLEMVNEALQVSCKIFIPNRIGE